jgi:hypothetical protein
LYIVNQICPEYYRLLDPNTGLLRSGKNREDAIQDVLQALWDLKEKEKAAKQVKNQRAGPVKTKLRLGSGEDTVPDDSQDVECGEDGNSEYGSVEEGLSVDGEVDGADEPMEGPLPFDSCCSFDMGELSATYTSTPDAPLPQLPTSSIGACASGASEQNVNENKGRKRVSTFSGTAMPDGWRPIEFAAWLDQGPLSLTGNVWSEFAVRTSAAPKLSRQQQRDAETARRNEARLTSAAAADDALARAVSPLNPNTPVNTLRLPSMSGGSPAVGGDGGGVYIPSPSGVQAQFLEDQTQRFKKDVYIKSVKISANLHELALQQRRDRLKELNMLLSWCPPGGSHAMQYLPFHNLS